MKKAIALLLAGLLALSLAACRGGSAQGNTAGNLANFAFVAIEGNRIYYSNGIDSGKLYSMNPDGSDKQKLNDDNARYINVVGDRLYYTDCHIDGNKNLNQLCSIKTDGTDRQVLGPDWCFSVTVVGDRIYYTDFTMDPLGYTSAGYIYSIKTDGTDQKKLCDDVIGGYTVGGGQIYYIDASGLCSMNLDGSHQKTLSADFPGRYIQVMDNRIFYTTGSASAFPYADDDLKIFSIKLDGSDRQKLTDDRCDYINAAGGRVYYIALNPSNMSICSVKTDGGDPRTLISGDYYQNINVAGGRVYYGDGKGGLYSMNIDGSDRQIVN